MACNKCKVAKGKCFKGKLAKDSPVLRSPGGIAARQLAQEKLASKKAYEAGKLHKKQIEELKKENEKLEGKLESLGKRREGLWTHRTHQTKREQKEHNTRLGP